jgi:hypothetical protein
MSDSEGQQQWKGQVGIKHQISITLRTLIARFNSLSCGRLSESGIAQQQAAE